MESRTTPSATPIGTAAAIVSPGEAASPTSNPSLTIVATSPSNSSVLVTSPSSLVVSFDRPLDPFSIGSADFDLARVSGDGSSLTMLLAGAPASESIDPNGSAIDLSLATPLAAGRYELLVDPSQELQGQDGSSLTVPGPDRMLSTFTVAPPQATQASATQLGVLGPQVTVVAGSLALASNPTAVQTYQFSLTPGHHWLVGLEVSAQSESSGLDSALSLYDSSGRLLATTTHGLADDPNDPFLFAGLDPGDYEVTVSAPRNVPNLSGDLSPDPSEADASEPDGSFHLDLIADLADQPTSLLGFQVNHADPGSAMPTGLTLQFSGPLGLGALESPTKPALILVDQAGVDWPLTTTGYDASSGQLSVAFDQALPPGSYSIELAGASSLLDLAGRPPVAAGLPAGTFGSFTVTSTSLAAGDLGPILPGLAASGLASEATVAPDQPTVERFEVIEPGFYALEGVKSGDPVRFQILDASGRVLVHGPSGSPSGATDFSLGTGVYDVVLTTTSLLPVTASFSIRQKANLLDSFIEAGVAQGPALGLRLVTPEAGFGVGPTAPAPALASSAAPMPQAWASSSSPSASSSAPSSFAGTAIPAGNAAGMGLANPVHSIESNGVTAPGVALPAISPALGLLSNGGPVGRSSTEANALGVVGISPSTVVTSITSNASSPGSATIKPGAVLERATRIVREASPIDPEAPSGDGLDAGLLTQSADSRSEDVRTLEEASQAGLLVTRALGWLDAVPVPAAGGEPRSDPGNPSSPSATLPASAVVEEGRLETASVASPLGLGVVVAVIAYRYRRKRQGSKTINGQSVPKSPPHPLYAGPHRRTMARVR